MSPGDAPVGVVVACAADGQRVTDLAWNLHRLDYHVVLVLCAREALVPVAPDGAGWDTIWHPGLTVEAALRGARRFLSGHPAVIVNADDPEAQVP